MGTTDEELQGNASKGQVKEGKGREDANEGNDSSKVIDGKAVGGNVNKQAGLSSSAGFQATSDKEISMWVDAMIAEFTVKVKAKAASAREQLRTGKTPVSLEDDLSLLFKQVIDTEKSL